MRMHPRKKNEVQKIVPLANLLIAIIILASIVFNR